MEREEQEGSWFSPSGKSEAGRSGGGLENLRFRKLMEGSPQMTVLLTGQI